MLDYIYIIIIVVVIFKVGLFVLSALLDLLLLFIGVIGDDNI